MNDFETHPIGTAKRLDELEHKLTWTERLVLGVVAFALVALTLWIIAGIVQAEQHVVYDPGCTEVHKLSSSPATCDDEWRE
jgi:hypothetical protein